MKLTSLNSFLTALILAAAPVLADTPPPTKPTKPTNQGNRTSLEEDRKALRGDNTLWEFEKKGSDGGSILLMLSKAKDDTPNIGRIGFQGGSVTSTMA